MTEMMCQGIMVGNYNNTTPDKIPEETTNPAPVATEIRKALHDHDWQETYRIHWYFCKTIRKRMS